jgi:hypothetical protein
VFEDNLKFKYAIYLICLLLFIAAVDTIPDPPAINPPNGHSLRISAPHFSAASTALEKEWFATPGSPRGGNNVGYSVWPVYDTRPAIVFQFPLVRHATDTSPPANS